MSNFIPQTHNYFVAILFFWIFVCNIQLGRIYGLLRDSKEQVVILCFHGSGMLQLQKQLQSSPMRTWLAVASNCSAVLLEVLQCRLLTTEF